MSRLSDEVTARLLASGPKLQLGTVQDVDDSTGVLTVTVAGNPMVGLDVAADYPPTVGDKVLVAQQGGYSWVICALGAAHPIQGAVASVSGSTVVVTTASGTFGLPFVASYTPVAGDTAIIMWQGTQGIVMGKRAVAAVKPPAPARAAPPPKATQSGVKTFPAVQSATFRAGDGWRDDTDDAIQGTAPTYPGLNNGAWFYGTAPHATLSGATVTKAEIYLPRGQGGTYAAQTIHVYRHTSNRRPAGNVGYASGPYDAAIPVGGGQWLTLPTAIGQAIVDSGGGFGVQAASGPYARMTGLSRNGQSGALRLTWRR